MYEVPFCLALGIIFGHRLGAVSGSLRLLELGFGLSALFRVLGHDPLLRLTVLMFDRHTQAGKHRGRGHPPDSLPYSRFEARAVPDRPLAGGKRPFCYLMLDRGGDL